MTPRVFFGTEFTSPITSLYTDMPTSHFRTISTAHPRCPLARPFCWSAATATRMTMEAASPTECWSSMQRRRRGPQGNKPWTRAEGFSGPLWYKTTSLTVSKKSYKEEQEKRNLHIKKLDIYTYFINMGGIIDTYFWKTCVAIMKLFPVIATGFFHVAKTYSYITLVPTINQ